jgi:ribosome biogenesis GTPase
MRGIVIKSAGNLYHVEHQTGISRCVLKGNFKIKGLKSTNPIAVGDFVEFEQANSGENGLITKIFERNNFIIRKSTNLSKQTHIIAANIDLAVLMITIIKPVTFTQFIDRFLASCEAFNIKALLLLNKIDILDNELMNKANEMISVYQKAGYHCLKISVKKNINIEDFITFILGKTIVVTGNSGVGKSSLINVLAPEINLKVSEVSVSHEQGRHTTTFAEMHKTGTGYIIDTPGIKGFGTVGIDKEKLKNFFPEFRYYNNRCKFKNCTHTHEPICAVKKAVESKMIDKGRYQNYLSIYFDEDTKYRQEDY